MPCIQRQPKYIRGTYHFHLQDQRVSHGEKPIGVGSKASRFQQSTTIIASDMQEFLSVSVKKYTVLFLSQIKVNIVTTLILMLTNTVDGPCTN
jgi:hypothetical protein